MRAQAAYLPLSSTTPRRAATRVALQTRPVAQQREVAAGVAGVAFVAFHAVQKFGY